MFIPPIVHFTILPAKPWIKNPAAIKPKAPMIVKLKKTIRKIYLQLNSSLGTFSLLKPSLKRIVDEQFGHLYS